MYPRVISFHIIMLLTRVMKFSQKNTQWAFNYVHISHNRKKRALHALNPLFRCGFLLCLTIWEELWTIKMRGSHLCAISECFSVCFYKDRNKTQLWCVVNSEKDITHVPSLLHICLIFHSCAWPFESAIVSEDWNNSVEMRVYTNRGHLLLSGSPSGGRGRRGGGRWFDLITFDVTGWWIITVLLLAYARARVPNGPPVQPSETLNRLKQVLLPSLN